MDSDARRFAGVAVAVVVVIVMALLWQAVLAAERGGLLRVSFLDIGQGDAVFIDTPSGVQVLIDGGPDGGVLRALSKEIAWFDRTLDVVIATHPDKDHIGGLVDVLERYEVAHILRSGVMNDTPVADAFARKVEKEGARELVAQRGQRIALGGGAFLDILFPDRDASGMNTNAGSVVARLVHGETSFLLTGDAPGQIEEYIASLDGSLLKSDVLKVGHHGSETSSSPVFVGFVSPRWAVISRGCNNRYGHPHETVLDVLARFDIKIFDTCEDGTITFISDGVDVWTR